MLRKFLLTTAALMGLTAMAHADEVEVLHESSEDHGIWSYHTIIARAHGACAPIAANQESLEVRWVNRSEVTALPLHPAFGKNWSALHKIIQTLP